MHLLLFSLPASMWKSFFRWKVRDRQQETCFGLWGLFSLAIFELFRQARPSPRRAWSAGVKWKPRTFIRKKMVPDYWKKKYNKTHPYLTLWLNFDFWCFPGFLVLQRECHYFINTVLSDNGLISASVSCTKSNVKLVATSQRMMKSAFRLFLYQSQFD